MRRGAARFAVGLSWLAIAAGSAAGQASPGDGVPTEVIPALRLARSNVERFFEQYANIVCAESVTQTVFGKNGKPKYWEASKYDYQLQASTQSGSLKLVESREPLKQAFRDPARTLLVTSGFVSLLLIMHPSYEASYTFEPAGEEILNEGPMVKIQFKPVAGGSSPAALQLRGKNYPMPLSGTVWVNKSSGAVAKLIASVDSSLSDLGLQGMQSEIHYALVQFHGPEESYWIPTSATIDVETPLQHWRNTHQFTGCRRFRSTIQVEFQKKP